MMQEQAGTVTLPPPPAAIHFVGIGGIGMSGLARILRDWGYQVSGSDAAASEQTEALGREGIRVTIGHADRQAAATAHMVVVTSAVRNENPELAAARASRVPIVKRAELLGMLANARRCVAVAGTHGKSSTSGMLAAALLALNERPSYAIGAVLGITGTNAAPGDGGTMVVEADEYDYSFVWLRPDVAIVTNIEFDHPDLFPDQAAYDDAFFRFISGMRHGGTLVIPADDPGCIRLLARPDFPASVRVTTFAETAQGDWNLRGFDGAWSVQSPDGTSYELPLAVPGRHNARNATAAVAALVALGIEPAGAARSLGAFSGVGRRFEFKGEENGVAIVDDYAHHPSEIRVTLDAMRQHFPGRRLWAVFQPHTYSRTKALMEDFAAELAMADEVILLDIYPSRETDTLGVSSTDLLTRLPARARLGGPPEQTVELLARSVRPGDVVVTLGAGDITSVGPSLLSALAGSGDVG